MKKMRNFLFGFLIIIAVLAAFLYGPKYMIVVGAKTEEAGKKLENYQKPLLNTVKGLI